MNILVVCDVPNWAIGHLAEIYVQGNPQYNFRQLYIHPKEVAEHVAEFRDSLPWADIVIMEYWNTARQLAEAVPEMKDKKCILMHHNQKDLLGADWNFYSLILSHTKKADSVLRQAGYQKTAIIPYGIEFSDFPYLEKYPANDEKLIGYAGRVVPWKNLKEVAAAAFDLGHQLLFMGKPDKVDYWNSIPQEHKDNMDMSFARAGDNDRQEFYRALSVFVNFPSDGREEGTLPLLEAMACGIPVVTTAAGTAADIIVNEKNGLLVPFGDYQALKAAIARVLNEPGLAERLRKAAWDTIRQMTPVRMARRYSQAIHQVYSPEPLVSVILPVHDARGLKQLIECCDKLDWPHKEIVVCDDSGSATEVYNPVREIKSSLSSPLKHLRTDKQPLQFGYNLAQARNLGIIEAEGEYLLFCDSRLLPEPDSIKVFMAEIQGNSETEKLWLFGDKDNAGKDTFVENFSFVRRQDLIDAGMFNERINQYGGMSQEVRERCMRQGFTLGFIPEAKATVTRGSHMNQDKRYSVVAMKDLLWKLNLYKK